MRAVLGGGEAVGWYTSHMRLLNKTFYKFLWSFVAVIATTLTLVLVVGVLGA